MVVNPVTIGPDAAAGGRARPDGRATASPASRWSSRTRGKLVGILTNRDVRFATDRSQPVARADDPGQPDHRASEGVSREEAKRLLHQHRIEKLLVVDDDYAAASA